MFRSRPKKGSMATVAYEVSIKTSQHYAEGSTDSTVYIQLVGSDGSESEWHKLDKFWRDDFEQGRTDEFTIKDKDLGKLQMIRLRLKHMLREDNWACDHVTIKHGTFLEEFPIYDWIFDTMEVLNGTALLPQNVTSDAFRVNIAEEIRHNKDRYAWNKISGPDDPAWLLPRFVPATDLHNVPHQLKMEDARFKHMSELRSAAQFNVIIETLQSYLFPIKTLDDYKSLFSDFRIPNDIKPCIERWQEDEEQGRQMLNGANPFTVSRCESLPEHCSITNELVKDSFKSGTNLENEIKNGRIYIADYSPLTKGLPRNTQYKSDDMLYCADTMALFHATEDGKFLPIAIQLEPHKAESVFTPKDTKYDWMLAKMYFRCADTNVHQWIYHFLWGHGIVETGATSMFRCLSRTHPMYKLCRPHLQHVVVIDQFARDILIFDNSPSNYTRSINGSALARNFFKDFDFNDLNFPELMKRRGLDSDKLQGYHYRHDATLLWDAIKRYISRIVRIYYKTDQDVKSDIQIQDWAYDLAHEGYGWADGNLRGCPDQLNTIEELITFVTSLIFTSCVQHTATHKPMFDFYKFVPNAPGGMRMPIHKKGEGSLQRVLDSLPDVTMATILLGSAFVLTELPEDEIYIGEFPMRLFTESEPLKVLEQFREELKEISKKIVARNEKLKYPYEYLLPEGVPTGTTA